MPPADLTNFLLTDMGFTVVYPLTDIVSGTAILAQGQGAGWNGTLSGWDLQNTPSPVFGSADSAPYLDGAADFGQFAGTSLASSVDWARGGVFALVRIPDAATWTDGTARTILRMQITGQYLIQITKAATSNQLNYAYRVAAGTQALVTQSFSDTNWFSVGISWGDAANGGGEQPYLNGSPLTFASTTGTSGTTGATLATFFCNSTTTNLFKGWGCYFGWRFGAKPSTADFAAIESYWRYGI